MELAKLYTSLSESERKEAAQELHQRILRSAEQAVCAIYDLGQNLSSMNESKLYTELGYQSLEEYTEKEFGFRQRQAYTYISIYEKLGRSFLQSNAKLGVTKLSLLTEVSGFDREAFLAEHDVEGMSVKELEELIRREKEQGEQISLLQERFSEKERESAGQLAEKRRFEKELEVLKERLSVAEQEGAHAKKTSKDSQIWYEKACEERDEALQRVKEMENRPVDIAVAEPDANAISKLREDLRQELESEKQSAVDAAVEAQQHAAEQALANQLEQARAEAKQEAEAKLKESLDSLQAEKLASNQRAEALAKQLAVSADKEFLEASFYFDSVKESFEKLCGVLEHMKTSSPEKAGKLSGGIRRILAILDGRLAGIGE